MLQVDIAVVRERFVNFYRRTVPLTPTGAQNSFIPFFGTLCSNALWQEKRFLLRVMYVYMGFTSVAYPGILFGGGVGVQQIQLWTEGGEKGSVWAVAT
jgi:hypothetical protein